MERALIPMHMHRMDSTMSMASVASEQEDPAVPLAPLPGVAESLAAPPSEWYLHEQTTRLEVDLEREELRGTVELRVRLPTAPALSWLRLNSAAQCEIESATLDGTPLEWEYAADEANVDQVVPQRWQRTRDLSSYQSVHGAVVHAAQDGELTLRLPPLPSPGSSPPRAAAAWCPLCRACGCDARACVDATLVLRYRVSRPRGGVHFVRGRGGKAVYVHSVGEAGAVRRWAPCLDRADLRCPKAALEVTCDAGLLCFGSGLLQPEGSQPTAEDEAEAGPRGAGGAGAAGGAGGRRRTWRFCSEHSTLASQWGFVCGRMQAVPHPTLPHTTLALGVAEGPTSSSEAEGGGGEGGEVAALRELWPQLLDLGRLLPPLFKFLHLHLLAPCEARIAQAARAAAAAAAAARAAAADDAARDAADDAAEEAEITQGGEGGTAKEAGRAAALAAPAAVAAPTAAATPSAPAAAAPAAAAPADSTAARRAALAPFREHVVCVLQGLASEGCSFCGLTLVHASLLHPPTCLEAARPLRLALTRLLGGSWLASAIWLRSQNDAWLLMAAEGRLLHAYVEHAFGRNEAVHMLQQQRKALCAAEGGTEALVPCRAEQAAWGGVLHPEQIYSEHRRRKAPLVLHMLARQCGRSEEGEKDFTKLMSKLVLFPVGEAERQEDEAHQKLQLRLRLEAGGQPGGGGRGASGAHKSWRIDSTASLLKHCKGISNTELSVFFRQWVYEARPPPTLRANFAYNKRRFQLELVLQQSEAGSNEVQLKGCELGIGWGEADRDGDGSYTQLKSVRLTDSMQLVELDVDARRKRSKRKRRGDDPDGEEGGAEVVVVGSSVPLLWVRLDPAMEWMVDLQWTGRPEEVRWSGQPEFMCREQLEHDKDVASQWEAAAALSTFSGSHSAMGALEFCLLDEENYYRVRAEAASSLSRLVSAETEHAALSKLLKLLKDKWYRGGQVAPNDFSDLAEYHVLKATIEAIGAAKDEMGDTPHEAIDLLLELLDDNDNAANEYDDSYYLGALLLLLGNTRAPPDDDGSDYDADLVSAVVAQVRRHMQLDLLVRSPHGVLTRCGLQALCSLELAGRRDPEWQLYLHSNLHGASPLLRLTAADCLLRLSLLLPASAPRPPAAHGGTLALALRLAEERSAAPLEELWLWQALLTLLRTAAPGEAGRTRLAAELEGAAEVGKASVQLLWQRMCCGTGHARLRFTLCEVWRSCFGASTVPRCLGISTPQPISHAQTHPAYTPAYVKEQGEEQAKAETQAEEKAQNMKAAMKVNLGISKGGAMVHKRHIDNSQGGALAQPQAIGAQSVEWRVLGARDHRVSDVERWVEHHRQGVEDNLKYTNVIVPKTAPPPLAQPAAPQPIMIKFGR